MNSKWSQWWLTLAVNSLFFMRLLEPGLAGAEDRKPGILVSLDSDRIPVSVEASGIPAKDLEFLKTLPASNAGFSEVLAVYVADPSRDAVKDSLPPISGRYKIEGASVIFTPRHPFHPGLKYRAVLRVKSFVDAGQSAITVEQEFAVPKIRETNVVPTRVAEVYPSDDKLPENLLRFYIHFSRSMNRGEAYRNLELLDESGRPIEAAFLELGEELWDPSGSRFTLLLDPGRVKHGLKPREELGPILKAGLKYTLLVKQSWRDGSGNPLNSEFRKTFVAGPAVDEAIDCTKWKMNSPAAGTKKQLTVFLDRGLDHALLLRTLSVESLEGQRIEGKITVNFNEGVWLFQPTQPWVAGSYFLVVGADLEDPAGNRIDRSFEAIQQDSVDSKKVDKTRRIRFEVRQPASN